MVRTTLALNALISLGLIVATPAAAQADSAACLPFTWTTLGTAGGPVPTPDRAEPSNLLRVGDRHILVDAGDGTVNQLARLGSNLGLVEAVFVSHHHLDHTGGLAAVVGLRWMNNFPGQLTVYGPPGTRELVDGLLASMQPQARVGFGLGAAAPPPAESVRVVELTDGGRVELGELRVTAAANTHFDHEGQQSTSGALSLSYRFEVDSRSITYSGDTGPSTALTKLAAESDLLVTEIMDFDALIEELGRQRPDMPATIRAQIEKHLFTHHLTGEQVAQLARSAAVGQVLLTHYAIPPAPLGASAGKLLEEIRTSYSGPVHFGRDLTSIDVGCR
jgi:ribonuclease BN (tRNA processing enzyme)